MSRSTQYIGLKHQALNFVRDFEKLPSQSETTGIFDEVIRLDCWRDKNGFIYREIEQEVLWSSGPVIFTCLEKETGTRLFEWTENEMSYYL